LTISAAAKTQTEPLTHNSYSSPKWHGRLIPATDVDDRVDTVKFTRITIDPRQMGGVPCLRGSRIPVGTAVAMIADGMSEAEILGLSGYRTR
jgi:hypothetical protein